MNKKTRSATDAASPTPPASDSPPACAERHSIQILRIGQEDPPVGETTAFHASTGENLTPAAATKPDYYKLTRSAYACRLVGSL
ncbi:hypothetical protein J6590_054501 [Homalodisca vitripennis]|nr:hypothetical protein J6590_054501 [Homalodisca vitripennis]